jgi:hypothetical protein
MCTVYITRLCTPYRELRACDLGNYIQELLLAARNSGLLLLVGCVALSKCRPPVSQRKQPVMVAVNRPHHVVGLLDAEREAEPLCAGEELRAIHSPRAGDIEAAEGVGKRERVAAEHARL